MSDNLIAEYKKAFANKSQRSKLMPRLSNLHAWFDYSGLYDAMIDMSQDGQVFVEIGSWFGKSTIYLALRAKELGKKIKIYAVDTWKGTIEHEEERIVNNRFGGDIYDDFLSNIRQFQVEDIITPLRLSAASPSLDAIVQNSFCEHSIDYLAINLHNKSWLVSDILHHWHDKVKDGGFISCRGFKQYKEIYNVVTQILGDIEEVPPNTCLYRKLHDKFCLSSKASHTVKLQITNDDLLLQLDKGIVESSKASHHRTGVESSKASHTVKLQITNDDLLLQLDKGIVEYKQLKRLRDKRVMLAPFRVEHFNDIDLIKDRIYCDKNEIDIMAFGTLNYFPIHTLYSHDAYFTCDEKVMQDIYTPAISTLGVARCFHPALSFYQKPINGRIVGPHNGSEFWGETSEFQEIAAKEISDDEVVEYLLNKPILIRRSSWDLFQQVKSELPRDIILCEIKQACINQIKTFEKYAQVFDLPLVGLHYDFQRDLVNKVGLHYLEFQILGSLFLNWQIVAIGGSSRLFSMLPTRNILLTTHDLYNRMHYIQSQLSYKRQSFTTGAKCPCKYCTIPVCNVGRISGEFIQNLEALRREVIWPEVELV